MVKKILIIAGCLLAAIGCTYAGEKSMHVAATEAVDVIKTFKNKRTDSNSATVEKTEEV